MKKVDKKIVLELLKNKHVVAVDNELKPRIRKGKEIPEEECIRVYVKQKLPAHILTAEEIIPQKIDDIPTDIIDAGGEIVALKKPLILEVQEIDPTKRIRPLTAGVSIGNVAITAGCLTKDALVFGNPEIKPITEFKSGDTVYVFSSNGIAKRKVKSVFDNGVKDVYLLRTQTGREIKATDNHPFLVARKVPNEYREKYRKALELRENSYPDYKIAELLGVDRRTVDGWIFRKHAPRPYRWVLLWTSLRELKPGDYIVVLKESPTDGKPFKLPNIEMKTHKKVIPNLPKETNNDLMWFFGYYLADGCISHKKSQLVVLISEGSKEKANKLISKLKKYGIHGNYYEKKMVVEISSTYLARLIEKLGFSGNAHTKRVPDWVLQLPKEQIKSFIEGFIFGDGYRHKSKSSEIRYGIEVCNYELLRQLRFLSQMIGWRTTSIHHRRRRSTMIDGRAIEGDTYSFDMYLPTVTKSRSLKSGQYISSSLKVPEPFGLDRIVEISYLGKENTYDLEIDGDEHNFIANNIVVHNSLGWFYQDKNGVKYLGSNAHVFTDGDPFKKPEEVVQKDIVQPGTYDGGKSPDDLVGHYVWHQQLQPDSTNVFNKMDFAVSTIEVDCDFKIWQQYSPTKLVGHLFAGSNEVTVVFKGKYIADAGYSPLNAQFVEVNEGDWVEKWGRTSGHKTGQVQSASAACKVNYGNNRYALFDDQIITDNISAGGDSGSSVWLTNPPPAPPPSKFMQFTKYAIKLFGFQIGTIEEVP